MLAICYYNAYLDSESKLYEKLSAALVFLGFCSATL